MEKIRVAIFGMGKLGNACKEIIESRQDEFELVECFTRVNADTLLDYKNQIDVLLVCVGSARDAPVLTPKFAKHFCTVDSFDTHAELETYMAKIRRNQGEGLVSVVGTGWDPGLLSILRLYLLPIFPVVETFWGPGVSLGHTNAVRKIKDVEHAIQFTLPQQKIIQKIKRGKPFKPEGKHKRQCYVVAPTDEHRRIAQEIKGMPHYFAPYKTKVKFITKEVFEKKYQDRREHAGLVLARDERSVAQFNLDLESNPRFTAQNMIAFAIATHNMKNDGKNGVFTVADIEPRYLFKKLKLEVI